MPRKTLYAEVTTRCNLTCPYCDIKNKEDNFNRELFMEQLRKFDGEIVLFGGEPSLYPDRLLDIYYSEPGINRKVTSISTNLMYIDDRLLTMYQIIGGVATSWNPDRFRGNEYDTWLENINIFGRRINTKLAILVTLVDSLLNMSADEVLDIISTWNKNVIKYISFEQYVGPEVTPEYFERCDNWLCEIYKKWNSPIRNLTVERMTKWYNDCSTIYTLSPDGSVRSGCPHKIAPTTPLECCTCEKAAICKPCQLQPYCSLPKKLFEMVNNKGEGI